MHGFANAHAELSVQLMAQTKNIQLPGIKEYDDPKPTVTEEEYDDMLGGMLNESARN